MARPKLAKAAAVSVDRQPDERPERTRGQTRQRILDAAAKVFRQHGYGAGLADIAEEAGIQAGSLYYHFNSRERLVEEVLHLGLELAWQHVNDRLAEAPDDATPGDRLALALSAHIASILVISDYTAANSRIFSMAADDVRARHYRLQKKYGDIFQSLFRAAIESGEVRPDVDPEIMRMLLFGAMNWTAEWYRPGRGRSARQVIEQFETLIVGGLWAPGKRPKLSD